MLYTEEVENFYSDCEDFICRKIVSEKALVNIYFIRGMCDRDYISERIIRPVTDLKDTLESFDGNFSVLLRSASLSVPENAKAASERLVSGECLTVLCNGNGVFPVLSNAQTGVGRSIGEPTSDVTVKGPKAGFVEDAERNAVMLRQYIRTSDLKIRRFSVGSISKTKVLLCYVKNRADTELVEDISEKLKNADARTVTDSENIAMLLNGKKYSLLPSVGSTEKADKASSKLMAGRIGIIVDGSPFVLTLPYLFAESIQSSDDYTHTKWYATFIRILRFFAFGASVFAPSVLVALGDYMPEKISHIITSARENVPVSLFLEIFCVLLLFELLREVGVRMPRTVGDAVGIVGSIILGDAAVQAGFVSTVSVITVALSAVCAFITPVFMYVTVLARFLSLLMSRLLGVWGLSVSICVFTAAFCCKKSFGVPYMYPLSPFDKKGLMDFLYADPKKILGRREIFRG